MKLSTDFYAVVAQVLPIIMLTIFFGESRLGSFDPLNRLTTASSRFWGSWLFATFLIAGEIAAIGVLAGRPPTLVTTILVCAALGVATIALATAINAAAIGTVPNDPQTLAMLLLWVGIAGGVVWVGLALD